MATLFQRTLDIWNKVCALEWYNPITGLTNWKHLDLVERLSKRDAILIKKDLKIQLIRKQHPVLMDSNSSITLKQLKAEFIFYLGLKDFSDYLVVPFNTQPLPGQHT